jgi:homoserine kinase
MNISGSGPSVFALSHKREIAHKAADIMWHHFMSQGIRGEVYVVKVTNKGAKLLAQ